jgi:hypothetical protein
MAAARDEILMLFSPLVALNGLSFQISGETLRLAEEIHLQKRSRAGRLSKSIGWKPRRWPEVSNAGLAAKAVSRGLFFAGARRHSPDR